VHAAGGRALAGAAAQLTVHAALLVGAAVAISAALCFGWLLTRYARILGAAMRARHPATLVAPSRSDTRLGLALARSRTADAMLALNDADAYAAWRLARVNALGTLVAGTIGIALVILALVD
jgi:hypothetical protein